MEHASYEVVRNESTDSSLVIRDFGPWDIHKTITNDAEWVVEELFRTGQLVDGMALFYYDSQDDLDQMFIRDRRFAGFRFG